MTSSRPQATIRVRRIAPVLLASGLLLSAPALAAGQDSKPRAVSPEEIHSFKPLVVPLGRIKAEGQILDIGGGEGVIGHVMGDQVVVIDVHEDKLGKRETESEKIVMDAREMTFGDGSFGTATAFFALLPFSGSDQVKVFGEVHRVLEPGGHFLVWDAIFGPRPEGKTVAVIPVSIKIKGEDIDTGYSRQWPDEIRDLEYYRKLAETAGFTVVDVDEKAAWFRFELEKPDPDKAEPESVEE